MGMLVGGFYSQEAAVVTVSGQTISSGSFDPADAYARLKILDIGVIHESKDTGSVNWQQIDAATDWVRPVGNAPGLYEVRFTSATNTPTFATVTENTWYFLSSGDFIMYNNRTSIGSKSTDFTIQIRLNGGAVLSSASYTLVATVNTPL